MQGLDRIFFGIGSVLAGTSVAAGAFGAHLLSGRLEPRMLAAFETGARYQMAHGLALLAVAWAVARWPGAGLAPAGWLLVAGVAVFSGSLYAMSLSGVRSLGAVTPLGGLAMIAGWLWLALGVLRAAR
jgi:uncharacterized membrane protein YgdD (TMEM256/DUF423 family)